MIPFSRPLSVFGQVHAGTCHELGHTWHPSCVYCCVEVFLFAYWGALKIYGPLYLVSNIVRRTPPRKVVTETLPHILRSSLFLAVNGGGFIGFLCILRNLIGRFYHYLAAFLPAFLASVCAISSHTHTHTHTQTHTHTSPLSSIQTWIIDWLCLLAGCGDIVQHIQKQRICHSYTVHRGCSLQFCVVSFTPSFQGHCGEVWCLAVSHDGEALVTGSHDYSLRVWERTDEPLILSDEREKEREEQFEAAVAEGGEPVIPGEVGEGEAVLAGKKTVQSMKAAEQLLEALAVYQEEKVKGQEWAEECKVTRRRVPRPKPHPILVAMGDLTPEKYMLCIVRRVKSSDLEEALLVMPFSDMVVFLSLLHDWIRRGWEVELSCRCLLFLLRIHHSQIVSNHILLPVLDSLREHTRPQVEQLRDMCGFNLAGLRSLQNCIETAGTPIFGDISDLLQKLRKKSKVVQRT